MSPNTSSRERRGKIMKIKYNFGLLKNQMIGFLKESDGLGYHGNLKNVRKKGNNYHFVYEDCYIEISEEQFLTCKLIIKDDIYYFIPGPINQISGLFVYSMYDTYGFPMEITEEILMEKGYMIDKEGFNLIKEIQKNKNKGTFKTKDAF